MVSPVIWNNDRTRDSITNVYVTFGFTGTIPQFTKHVQNIKFSENIENLQQIYMNVD